MAEINLEKNGEKIFHYESKKDNENECKKKYRGVTKFEYQLMWTGLWMAFIIGLCAIFDSAAPLWLFIFWIMGNKW